MRRSTRKWLAAAAALALSGAPITANAEYAVIDLGALVNTATGHRASVGAINSTGQVTLTNAPGGTAYHGFRYAAGATLDLGTLGGSDSSASGINNSGQIVGQSNTAAGIAHAFVWTPGGAGGVPSNPQMRDLNPTGGISAATSINATGQVAGYVAVPGQGQSTNDRAFLYSGGTLTQIPLPAGNFSISFAYGLNDKGKVIGEAYKGQSPTPSGFLFDGVSSVEIGSLGGSGSTPLAINNNDRVVGYSTTSDGYDHAFVYAGASMTDIGTLGGHYSYAKAINNNDQIVGGSFTDDADSVYHAFTSDGANMTDLNAKVTSKAADWVLTEATGVNDAGVIVGTGMLAGQRHGFLLRPLLAGDANADGKVDFNDLVALAQNYNSPDGADWEHGDFSGDGRVDFNDLVALAQNYNTGQDISPQFASDLQAAMASVPEPSAPFAAAIAAGFLVARRRRRIILRGCLASALAAPSTYSNRERNTQIISAPPARLVSP